MGMKWLRDLRKYTNAGSSTHEPCIMPEGRVDLNHVTDLPITTAPMDLQQVRCTRANWANRSVVRGPRNCLRYSTDFSTASDRYSRS
jgi:hypothetical protein